MTCPKEQKQTLLNKWLRQKYDIFIIIIKVKDSFRFVRGLLYIAVNIQIKFGWGMVYCSGIRQKKLSKMLIFTKKR